MTTPSKAVTLQLMGLQKVLKNLKISSLKISRNVEKGLLLGGAYLRNESLKIVPVQIGNLRDSAYAPRNVGGKGMAADIVVGYTAEYALWVHEVPNRPPKGPTHGKEFNIKHRRDIVKAHGTWLGTAEGGMFRRKPREQWKFLETPMRDKKDQIFKIIGKTIRATR